MDPLAEQFPAWNPYHYVHNNPINLINLIDPTGMRADPPTEGEFENGYVHTDSDGSWTYNNGIWSDNSGGGNDFLEGINFTVPGNNSNLSDAVSAGQMFGGAATGIMGDMSQIFMDKSSYLIGTSHYSNSIDFYGRIDGNVGVNAYSKGYKVSMNSIKNLNAGLNVTSKVLNYAGYIDGGLKISQGDYVSGAHSIGNNYLGIKIGTVFGWGYGLLYSASYTTFENTLPKSELYNRVVFGTNSPTYYARRYHWTKSKFEP